jgi:hypothetical protein
MGSNSTDETLTNRAIKKPNLTARQQKQDVQEVRIDDLDSKWLTPLLSNRYKKIHKSIAAEPTTSPIGLQALKCAKRQLIKRMSHMLPSLWLNRNFWREQ